MKVFSVEWDKKIVALFLTKKEVTDFIHTNNNTGDLSIYQIEIDIRSKWVL